MLINQLTKTVIQFCSVEFREIENQSKMFHFKLIDKKKCIQTWKMWTKVFAFEKTLKHIQWYRYQNVKYKYWNMKNQRFSFLKNDKSTCFNLRFGPCGLLMIFWTDATVAVHSSSEVSPLATILLPVLLVLAEIAELLESAILVELLVFTKLVELLAFEAIVTLLAFIRVSQCQIRFCEFVSVCILFFKSFFVSWFCLTVPREDFFSLNLFCNVFQSL